MEHLHFLNQSNTPLLTEFSSHSCADSVCNKDLNINNLFILSSLNMDYIQVYFFIVSLYLFIILQILNCLLKYESFSMI